MNESNMAVPTAEQIKNARRETELPNIGIVISTARSGPPETWAMGVRKGDGTEIKFVLSDDGTIAYVVLPTLNRRYTTIEPI